MSEPKRLEQQNITAPVDIPSLQQFLAFVKQNNLARQERFFVSFPNDLLGSNNNDLSFLCHQASLPGKNIGVRTLRINGLDRQFAQTADYTNDITLEFLMDTDFRPRAMVEDWMARCVERYNTTDSNEVGYYSDYVRDLSIYALIPAGIPGEALFNWSPTQADLGLRNKATLGRGPLNTAVDKLMLRSKRLVDNKFTKLKSQAFGAVSSIAAPLLDLTTDAEQIAYRVKLVDAWPKSMNIVPLGFDAVGVMRMNVTFTFHHWTSSFSKVELSGQDMADSATAAVSKYAKKFTDKLPNVDATKLGADLRSKATSLTRRFGR